VEPSGTAEPESVRLPGGVSLQPGEQVLFVIYRWWLAVAPFYLFTLGLYEIWRRRRFIALTNERLLYCKGILLFKTQRSIPVDRVQDATYKRALWMGLVDISSAGGSFGKISDAAYKPSQAREFVARLHDRIEPGQVGEQGLISGGVASRAAGGASPARPDTYDPAASLRQLQRLKDQGLLTDDEYAEKRQEILKRL
jgi:membrane protein YdbS with pleckstrin-like domain